jgi:hypothetical protein
MDAQSVLNGAGKTGDVAVGKTPAPKIVSTATTAWARTSSNDSMYVP